MSSRGSIDELRVPVVAAEVHTLHKFSDILNVIHAHPHKIAGKIHDLANLARVITYLTYVRNCDEFQNCKYLMICVRHSLELLKLQDILHKVFQINETHPLASFRVKNWSSMNAFLTCTKISSSSKTVNNINQQKY